MARIKVLCWSEFTEPREVYPNGIHGAVAEFLAKTGEFEVRTAQLDDPEQGLSEEALRWADVLVWFGHGRHQDVNDTSVERVVRHVTERGMGFVPLHSSHKSRPFTTLMGTSGALGGWREEGEPERIFIVEPDHPTVEGISDFTLPQTEMYTEPFDVPPPDLVVFYSVFLDGYWFRSGCYWQRGAGRIFYFRPGHETYPIFYDERVQKIVTNAVRWVARRE